MWNKIRDVQQLLKKMHIDGWLIYDFRGSNDLGCRFLELASHFFSTRRFLYWIPADGEPVKVVHAIEPFVLDHWPGEKRMFVSWQSFQQQVSSLMAGVRRVAMEYSPKNMIPYVSKVDAGTVDLVRSFGVEVVSSAMILPHFTAVISEEQGKSHIRAGLILNRIVGDIWEWISERLKTGQKLTDYDVQQRIVSDFAHEKLVSADPPIVAVGPDSANPHFQNSSERQTVIQAGDWILIDLWAKEDQPQSIYGDISRVAVIGSSPTDLQKKIFSIVHNARKAATELVKSRFAHGKEIYGWEVDECARQVICDAGYENCVIHRTGHSIEESVHGSGANMDNLETHDDRPILPSTCFSIEPSIYLPNQFGVRLEYDLYVHRNGHVEIVGGEQNQIIVVST
jgi:Xaa-Pro dipeptidase